MTKTKTYTMILTDYNSCTIYAVANTVLGLVRNWNKNAKTSPELQQLKVSDINIHDDSHEWNAISGLFDSEGNEKTVA